MSRRFIGYVLILVLLPVCLHARTNWKDPNRQPWQQKIRIRNMQLINASVPSTVRPTLIVQFFSQSQGGNYVVRWRVYNRRFEYSVTQFTVDDTNRDNVLTREEYFGTRIRNPNAAVWQSWNHLLARIDNNNDGKIQKTELPSNIAVAGQGTTSTTSNINYNNTPVPGGYDYAGQSNVVLSANRITRWSQLLPAMRATDQYSVEVSVYDFSGNFITRESKDFNLPKRSLHVEASTDIAVQDLYLSSQVVKPGEAVNVNFRVANLGGQAPNGQVRYWIEIASAPAGPDYGKNEIGQRPSYSAIRTQRTALWEDGPYLVSMPGAQPNAYRQFRRSIVFPAHVTPQLTQDPTDPNYLLARVRVRLSVLSNESSSTNNVSYVHVKVLSDRFRKLSGPENTMTTLDFGQVYAGLDTTKPVILTYEKGYVYRGRRAKGDPIMTIIGDKIYLGRGTTGEVIGYFDAGSLPQMPSRPNTTARRYKAVDASRQMAAVRRNINEVAVGNIDEGNYIREGNTPQGQILGTYIGHPKAGIAGIVWFMLYPERLKRQNLRPR